MKHPISLTTPEGNRILVDVDQIESIVEHPQAKVNFPTGSQLGWTDINMKSGDRGKCRELFDDVSFKIYNALA